MDGASSSRPAGKPERDPAREAEFRTKAQARKSAHEMYSMHRWRWTHRATGELVSILSVALDEETLELVVVYQGDASIWSRPFDTFMDGRFKEDWWDGERVLSCGAAVTAAENRVRSAAVAAGVEF